MSNDSNIVYGKDLKVGDVVSVWWSNEAGAEIIRFDPYRGKYSDIFDRIAVFKAIRTVNPMGMSISDKDTFKLIRKA